MSLRGSLDTFALTDVLALLATTAKSGELHVTGSSGDGRVWLDAGQVVGADGLGTSDVVDVLVGLLRLDEGDFAFHGDRGAPAPGTPADVAGLLERAEARLAEWREVEQILPSDDVTLSLVLATSGTIRLSRDQWAAVVAIGDGRPVHELVGRLGGDELARWRLLAGLVEAGLVEVGAAPTGVAPVARGELAAQLSTLTVAALGDDDNDKPRPATVDTPEPATRHADTTSLPVDGADDPEPVLDDADELEPAEDHETEPAVEPASAAAATNPTDPADGVSRGTLLKFLSSVRS
ncbi:MAG: hypothetical protein QOE35_3986 [Actinomycetota bacterium]|jgi:hypothetical protein